MSNQDSVLPYSWSSYIQYMDQCGNCLYRCMGGEVFLYNLPLSSERWKAGSCRCQTVQPAGQTLHWQALCPTALLTHAENKISFCCLTCSHSLSSFISLLLFSVCLWPSQYLQQWEADRSLSSQKYYHPELVSLIVKVVVLLLSLSLELSLFNRHLLVIVCSQTSISSSLWMFGENLVKNWVKLEIQLIGDCNFTEKNRGAFSNKLSPLWFNRFEV